MHTSSLLSFALWATGIVADLHKTAVCIKDRTELPIGGTPYSPSYNWVKDYEILPDATKCACDMYRQRNTGDKQWDQCPDCTFDGLGCNSEAWHIGGDEFNYYCTKKCGAEGAEAD